LPEEVEKNLLYGGLLISLGVGGLFGFWSGVLSSGVLLFGVSLVVLFNALRGAR